MKHWILGFTLAMVLLLGSCGTNQKTAQVVPPAQEETRQETQKQEQELRQETPPPATQEEREAPMQAKGPVMPTSEEIEQMNNEWIVFDTDMGMIKLELFPEAAPITCNNFRNLVQEGFFNGIIFHRVIPEFMIQAGGFTAQSPKNVPYKFKDEINPESLGMTQQQINMNRQRGYVYDNALTSIPLDFGVLAMANAGPHTNGSQFFIITKKDGTDWLNGAHTGFGRVVEGIDIALQISAASTDPSDRPVNNITIRNATIVQK